MIDLVGEAGAETGAEAGSEAVRPPPEAAVVAMPGQPRARFESRIFAVSEKLPHSLTVAFGAEGAATVQLKEREDGRCFDELYAIAQFVLGKAETMQDIEGCIRDVREGLPSLLLRRGLLGGEEEESRYAATLRSLRYIDWVEAQVYLDEAGFDATVLNNVHRGVGKYVYRAQRGAYNRGGDRPHLLVALQANHWKLVLKREADGLCLWHNDDVASLLFEEDDDLMPVSRDTVQTLLPLWETDS